MSCPNCHSIEFEMTDKKDDGQGYYEEEEYTCSKCNCVWVWKMEKEIIKEGKKH